MQPQTSIVLELQRLASDDGASVTEVLRKALMVATKLKIEEAKGWIQAELNGYRDSNVEVPPYRHLKASIEAFNPYQNRYIPCLFEDVEYGTRLAKVAISNPISELEEAVNAPDTSYMVSQFSPRELNRLMDGRFSLKPEKRIATSRVGGIVSIVRTKILEWALQLEQEGILGEGMTFSESEKKKAAESPNIHVAGDFKGVLGNVNTHNFQVGDYGSIHNQLKESGVSQEERNELESILDELKKAKPEERAGIVQRGMNWLGKNAATLGALGTVIKGWLTGMP